jgi:hypothetical protein
MHSGAVPEKTFYERRCDMDEIDKFWNDLSDKEKKQILAYAVSGISFTRWDYKSDHPLHDKLSAFLDEQLEKEYKND